MNDNRKDSAPAQKPAPVSPERRKLLALLDETLDAMPEDSAPGEIPLIALVLVGEALSSAARKGILPMSERFSALAACRQALNALPPAQTLADFRQAAKGALAGTDFGV